MYGLTFVVIVGFSCFASIVEADDTISAETSPEFSSTSQNEDCTRLSDSDVVTEATQMLVEETSRTTDFIPYHRPPDKTTTFKYPENAVNFDDVVADAVKRLEVEFKATVQHYQLKFDHGCSDWIDFKLNCSCGTSPLFLRETKDKITKKILVNTERYYNFFETDALYVSNQSKEFDAESFVSYNNFLNMSGEWNVGRTDGLQTIMTWDTEDTYNVLGKPTSYENSTKILVANKSAIQVEWYQENITRTIEWKVNTYLNGYITVVFSKKVNGSKLYRLPFSEIKHQGFSPWNDSLMYETSGSIKVYYGGNLSTEVHDEDSFH